MDGQTRTLPPDLEKRVRKPLGGWGAGGKGRRLGARDASLWTSADEASWLGWLGIAEDQASRIDRLRRVADDVAREGFTRALLLGMGGSSLCPEVLKETFGRIDGFPEVLVLDSTDPAQIRAFERKVDVARFLGRAQEMANACAPNVPVENNPGAVLGVILGVLATHGRDKVTLVASPAIYDLGAWLEQLLAESTGKDGKGLIPVDREPLGPPAVYGADRLFVYLRLAFASDARQDEAVRALEHAGQPVVRIALDDSYDAGAEFFRWEFATAVAGSRVGA